MADTTLSKTEKSSVATDPRVDAAAREKLVTARIGLLLKAPFFGNLSTRLVLENADAWCPTAATDGRRFYYNSRFIDTLSLKETEFLFGHEVLHVVYDHMGRRGTRDPVLWNIADDYCVNSDLIEQRIGEKITKVPILFNSKYNGKSAEEVYDDLYSQADKIDLKSLVKQLLDEHLDGDDEADGEGNGEGTEKISGSGLRPKLSKEERQQIRDEIKEAVISAANAAGAGGIPSGVKRLIKNLTEPVLNWRELIQQQIQSVVKCDYSWARPSRRSWHSDAVMPGMKHDTMVDVAAFIDVSGSISETQAKDFLSEIKGLMDQFGGYNVLIGSFDTEIYNVKVYTNDDGEDIAEYEPMGGGGTDPHAIWTYLKDNQIEPKKLIVFTDYCFYGWRPEEVADYCDTVWVIHGNEKVQPEFGIWAHYEPNSK